MPSLKKRAAHGCRPRRSEFEGRSTTEDLMGNPTARASRSPAGSNQASTFLGLVVFLLELLLLAVLAIAGARLGNDTVTSILLAVGLPLAAALVWGLLLAPRAARR